MQAPVAERPLALPPVVKRSAPWRHPPKNSATSRKSACVGPARPNRNGTAKSCWKWRGLGCRRPWRSKTASLPTQHRCATRERGREDKGRLGCGRLAEGSRSEAEAPSRRCFVFTHRSRVGKGASLGLSAWAKSHRRLCPRSDDTARDFAHPTAWMRTTIACGILHHVKQPNSFPRPHCCVRALPLCFTHPIEGWAERRETYGCCASAPVGRAVTRHVRRLRGALRPMTRDARLSALHRGGFGHRVRAFQSPAPASARACAGIRIRLSELLAARS
jgi:hypothetical protein